MLLEDKTQIFNHGTFQKYNIVKTAESDDDSSEWPWYRRRIPHLMGTPLSILSWILSIRFVVLLGQAVFDGFNKTKIVALCFFMIQICLLIARLIEEGWRLLFTESRQRPRLRLVGNNVPRADIVITTCGEDLDVVMDTVHALCDLDYPADKYRVLVSDDATNPALEDRVLSMASKTPVELLYYSRPNKGGMKAGNMNAAMHYLDRQGAADFCAFADVDMMFEPEFLRATLPLLLEDEAVGVAAVPQRFYNVPTNDPLYQNLTADGNLDEIQRDSMGAAWNTGPGIVFRCKAVRSIGGFPMNALAEELLTGFTMQGQGWKVAYCHEELQWGLVPETLNAHVTQRTKWGVGRLRNFRRLGCALWSPMLREMTFKQRISAFCHLVSPFASMINRVLCSWLVLVLIATGYPLIPTTSSSQLRNIIIAYVLASLSLKVEELLASASCGFFALRRRSEGLIWFNTHLFFSLIKDIVPKSLGGIRIGFTPTALSESKIQERFPERRPGLMKRLQVMVLRQNLWYHVLVLSLAAVIFARGVIQVANTGDWTYLLTHVLVPGAEWSSYFALARPLAYAVFPPSMPERRELMECSSSRPRPNTSNDAQTPANHQMFDVWRPKAERKLECWDTWALLPEVPGTVGLAFWSAVAIGWLF